MATVSSPCTFANERTIISGAGVRAEPSFDCSNIKAPSNTKQLSTVDQALRDILGEQGYEDLVLRGGYRRDVY